MIGKISESGIKPHVAEGLYPRGLSNALGFIQEGYGVGVYAALIASYSA